MIEADPNAQKKVILANHEWKIVLHLILERQEECTYINRTGYLLIERLSEKIEKQL